jgi:hypothetical protein
MERSRSAAYASTTAAEDAGAAHRFDDMTFAGCIPSRRHLAALLFAAYPACAFAQLEGTKVRIFLCDTEAAALSFAVERSAPKITDDMASDIVNQAEGRNACNRYIGYVVRETEGRKISQGLLFKVTKYRLRFLDNRGPSEAWSAERLFDSSPRDLPRDL